MALLDAPISNLNETAAQYKTGTFTLLAPGWQPLRIIKSERTPNSDGDGFQFELDIQAKNGLSFKKWICYSRNNSEKEWQATNGRAELATIAIACQFNAALMDTTQLHNKWFMGNVTLKDQKKINENTGKPYQNNEVREYKIYSEGGNQTATQTESNPW